MAWRHKAANLAKLAEISAKKPESAISNINGWHRLSGNLSPPASLAALRPSWRLWHHGG